MEENYSGLIESADQAISAVQFSDDEAIRFHAVWWLGKYRIKESVALLCECLSNDRGQTALGGYPLRRQAARSLGLLKDKSAIPALVSALDCPDFRLHEAVILSLQSIGCETAIPALISYFGSESMPRKPYEALIETLAHLKAWQARELVEPFLEHDSERVRGAASAYCYMMSGDRSYLDYLLINLGHQNRFIRQSAAFDLSMLGDSSIAKDIVCSRIPNNVKLATLKQIAEREVTDQVADYLSMYHQDKYLHDSIEHLLADAVEGNIQASEGDAQQSSDVQRVISIAEKIDLPGEEFVLSDSDGMFLVDALKSSVLSTKLAAIDCLERVASHSMDFIGQTFEQDDDQDVKAGLVQVMFRIGDARLLPQLDQAIGLEVANHCQGKLRRVATLAIGIIGSKEDDADRLVQIVDKLSWLASQVEDWALRYCAIISLEMIGDARSFSVMNSLGESETEPLVRCRLQRAISTFS